VQRCAREGDERALSWVVERASGMALLRLLLLLLLLLLMAVVFVTQGSKQ